MKVILRAFETLEQEYDAPIQNERQPLFFVHRRREPFLTMMKEVPTLDKIPDSALKKARFEWEGKWEDEMPIYEFIDLE